MEALYQEFRDIAEFRLIYIREAHAADGNRPVDYAKTKGIFEHQTTADRCSTAKELIKDNELTIPCFADWMDDQVNQAYSAWPDRIFVVRTDGRLAIAAERGPRGFEPALKATRRWLEAFKQSQVEPPLPQSAAAAGRERHLPAPTNR